MFYFIIALWLAATCLDIEASSVLSTHTVTTCDFRGNVQRLSCDRGVIAVQAALYGRQDRETCSYGWIMDHPSDTNCFQEGTKEVLQKRCDGRSTCEVPLYVFHWSDPCYGTSKYLESTYACVGHPEIKPMVHNVVECEHSDANLYCGLHKVIHVVWAHYGRTNRNTCSDNRPWSQLSNVHCKNYVTRRVVQECNGHSSCSVRASNSVFGDPCRGTYKYLEVKYFCRGECLSLMH
ncbi:L-rhamnose-binding lectin SML-like [Periophthalmus magnuspinnatus]|uniref:L-rhamnose-binding lectin SML-like n=1 Tax=Periophthalmus magnuspinnatus TaxID=409849 RepID=UPI00145A64F9|nr:L-rhamnose-binding lectin SML-like [Periophthalmus magnuspinnatus]